MTLGIPADADINSLEPALDAQDGQVAFRFERWQNLGGGHEYESRLKTLAVYFKDQDCSCGVLGSGDASKLMDVRLMPHLALLAKRVGEIQFLIHWHHDGFTTEPFEITREVELRASELHPLIEFEQDVRYVVKA
jgi:hypothetical protein